MQKSEAGQVARPEHEVAGEEVQACDRPDAGKQKGLALLSWVCMGEGGRGARRRGGASRRGIKRRRDATPPPPPPLLLLLLLLLRRLNLCLCDRGSQAAAPVSLTLRSLH